MHARKQTSSSRNKSRLAGEAAAPRDPLEWQSLVASCLTSTLRQRDGDGRVVVDDVDDIDDDFEVQSSSSSIFHLSDSSTHSSLNWTKWVVADSDFRWGFLKALSNALRAPHGVLYRDAPLSTVVGVIRTLERYWGDLCDEQDVDIVHTVYETIRDCYKQRAAGASSSYNPDDHLALKCASLHSLTVLLVEVNLITRNQRMVKFHVDHLVRLLFSGVSDDDVIAKATNLWLLRATASKCLCMMEKDVPTLLARQGAMYAREAMAEEGSTAVKGFPKTSLAVTVLAHACARYSEHSIDSIDSNDSGDSKDESVRVFSVVSEDDNLSITQRFHFPRHLEPGAEGGARMTEYARATVAELFLFAADVMRRMNAETIKRMSEPLRVLASHAGLEQQTLWPVMLGLIETGNANIMEFVLDTHDRVPLLFEGRRPSLLEKIIARTNDGSFSLEQRQLCLRWVARQHALARANYDEREHVAIDRGDGGEEDDESGRSSGSPRRGSIDRAFLLDDCWMQLLPLENDEISIVHLRIKVLAGCLATRVGDSAVIATGILLWPMWSDPKHSDKFFYAMRQLYRTMDTAEYCDEGELRAEASFIRAVVHASVVFPHLLSRIEQFLDMCDDIMRVRILAGYAGLVSQLDEQFEVLRVDTCGGHGQGGGREPREPPGASSSVLQKSTSTLAGMMRGLSLRLSRRSMGAAADEREASTPAPTTGVSSPAETPAASRAGSFKLPNSATNSRRQLLSSGGDSRRSIESISPTRGLERQLSTPTGEHEMRPFRGSLHRHASSSVDLTLPDLQHVDELEEWILSDRTWSFLKHDMLRSNDLMAYRSILHRIVRRADIKPCSVLKTVANYCWQFKSPTPHLALGLKETGAAILAIVQTAALAHLPLGEDDAEPHRQRDHADVVEAIHEVLDAIQDGFPCPITLKQAIRMSKLVSDEDAWRPSRSLSTMATMLGGYIEAAVVGVQEK